MSDKEMPTELVATKILFVRGKKVILDRDLYVSINQGRV
jgi:hypothetical protein